LNGRSAVPTSESRAGCVHNSAVRRMAGMVRRNSGGASDVRRHSSTNSTDGVVVAVCT